MKRHVTVIFLAILGVLSFSAANFGAPERAIGSDEQYQGESLFAELDENGTVLRVIVADADVINSGLFGNPTNWVRTFNDGGKRRNYAGVGDTYDKTRDGFIKPRPTSTAILNEETLQWELPNETPR